MQGQSLLNLGDILSERERSGRTCLPKRFRETRTSIASSPFQPAVVGPSISRARRIAPAQVPHIARSPVPCLARRTNSSRGSYRPDWLIKRAMAVDSPPGMINPRHCARSAGVRTWMTGSPDCSGRECKAWTCSAKEPCSALVVIPVSHPSWTIGKDRERSLQDTDCVPRCSVSHAASSRRRQRVHVRV